MSGLTVVREVRVVVFDASFSCAPTPRTTWIRRIGRTGTVSRPGVGRATHGGDIYELVVGRADKAFCTILGAGPPPDAAPNRAKTRHGVTLGEPSPAFPEDGSLRDRP